MWLGEAFDRAWFAAVDLTDNGLVLEAERRAALGSQVGGGAGSNSVGGPRSSVKTALSAPAQTSRAFSSKYRPSDESPASRSPLPSVSDPRVRILFLGVVGHDVISGTRVFNVIVIARASRSQFADMAYRFLCCRFRWSNRWGLDAIAKGLEISHDSARRGLHSAGLAGLLVVEPEPGCKLAVSTLDGPKSETGLERRPLYRPIPWSWWLPASRLPGRSLQVASVCWLLAGWSRSADFELALDGWAEFGLSRFSGSRGIDGLKRAGLLSVSRTPGQSPVVTILEVASNG
jgi:hypothetical protein